MFCCQPREAPEETAFTAPQPPAPPRHGGEDAVARLVAAAFPHRKTQQPHLLLGLTVQAMRDVTRAAPRGPTTLVCPGHCRSRPEPARSQRGWTAGSDELPRVADVRAREAEAATIGSIRLQWMFGSSIPDGTPCAQCAGPLDDPGQLSARGCPGCKWYVCGECARAPATNGYENQEVIRARADGKSAAETLLADRATAPGVGPARYFVSWCFAEKLDALFEALDAFAAREGLEPATTFFWVSDYVVRPGADTPAPPLFARVIRDVGRTLVLADPWHDPSALRRTWCLWEAFKGAEAGAAPLELILSAAQAESFRRALREDFYGAQARVRAVDFGRSDARDAAERRALVDEVERQGGASALDARVHDALRAWLARAARAELDKLPAAKRATSKLAGTVARLLQAQGNADEAAALLREHLARRRAALGAAHPDTLTAMNDLALALEAEGELDEAERLYREALEGCRQKLGPKHPDTMAVMGNLQACAAKARGEGAAAE